MKRILFVSAGKAFPESAFNFLKSLQEQDSISVTGLFFSALDYNSMISVSHIPIGTPYLRLKEGELHEIRANKEQFARKCTGSYLKFHIHDNEEPWDNHLFARETRFADLVVLSGKAFYEEIEAAQPNLFLQEALHTAECPVMIIPEHFVAPEHICIAYDGSRDSLYAIKQFCYLFPRYTELPTEIIYVREETSKDIPELELLKDFSRLHFTSMSFSKLHFKAAGYFADWIGGKQRVMLVSGSFGRSPFSYIARQSFARQAVHDHKLPIFIAHT